MMDNNYFGGFEADQNDAMADDYYEEDEIYGWEYAEEIWDSSEEDWRGTSDVLPF